MAAAAVGNQQEACVTLSNPTLCALGQGGESELLRDVNLWQFITISHLMTDDARATWNVLLSNESITEDSAPQ